MVLTCGEGFGHGARDDHAAGRHMAPHFDRFVARDVNDFGAGCEHNVSTQYGFGADVNTFYDDATRANECTIFYDDWRGL